MKIYKRILTGILAMSMVVSTMPTGMAKVYADEKTSIQESTYSSESETKEEKTKEETSAQETSAEESSVEETSKAKETLSEKETKAKEETSTEAKSKKNEVRVQANTRSGYLSLSEAGVSNGSITIDKAEQLIKLSNCNPKELQSITININVTGQLDTRETVGGYSFQGIGSKAYPFQGKITGENISWKINRPFFGGLSSKANIKLSLNWCGDEKSPMIAEVYQFDSKSENGHNLPVNVNWGITQEDSDETKEKAKMGNLFDTVRASEGFENQVLNIGNIVDYTNATEVKVSSTSGNAGLICNTLENGTICLDGYNFPTSAYTVKSTAGYNEKSTSAAGNAGGVIGMMANGTTLEIKSAVNIPSSTVINSNNGNAGGLVGLMQENAKIKMSNVVTLEKPQITGKVSAGGIVGTAEKVSFAESNITVNTPTVSGDGANVGGFIGKYVVNTDTSFPNNISISNPTLKATGSGVAGGYFGQLDLQGNYAIGSTNNNKEEVKPTYTGCSAKAIGAIAGKVTSNNIGNTLLIQNMKTTATNFSGKDIQYHGGLIGETGSGKDAAVYLEISNVEVNVTNSTATESGNYGFGGLVGFLAQGSILKSKDTVKISTTGDINQGGGYVGYAENSVINVTGTTDLSDATYAKDSGKNAKTGWFVGKQESALIYANGDGNGNGWKYIRGKENTAGKQAMNDIGNYGQIIRLKSGESASKLSSNLIEINEKHNIEYGKQLTSSDDTFTIDSVDVFALLSIAWNTRGYFGGATEITSDSLKSMNITLSGNIDLTGSGISGLTRDLKTDEDTYAGTFNGGSHTIKLSIGETFGYKQSDTNTLASDSDDGYGEVIAANLNSTEYHSRQGLFARIQNAKISNLTIEGNIKISNAGKDILAGGIAGESAGNPSVSNVDVKETINADCVSNAVVAVGGFYGGSYSGEPQFGEVEKENTLNVGEATINIQNCSDNTEDTKIYAGGLIGEINSWSYKLKAYKVKISGSITTDAKKYAYVGGLVGIVRGGSTHWMEIKGVTFDIFKIDAPNVTKICGGLFGSIWENVGLYFMKKDGDDGTYTKLDVKNAEINAPNAEYVGGLAYRSSGIWEIRNYGINLKKLTINAGKNVGLLVCRGEKSTETVAGSSNAFNALYLCTTKYWETAYKIENVDITTANNGVFDEFVAYTTPSAEEITDNGKNGVISIATQEETKSGVTSCVGVDVKNCTTYQNRTNYGKNHKTNACSRYYYDLDQCLTDMETDGIANDKNNNQKLDTPQELLLWSVYNYACQNIKKIFAGLNINDDIDKKTPTIPDIKNPPTNSSGGSMPWAIGGKNSDSSTSEMDMSKYSYYPIKYEGNSVNITDTKLIFNNENIETIEKNNDNKSTQGTNTNHTQHYAMHCGLFLNYQSGGVRSITLTVRDVTFVGSIGKVNNGTSGVLVSNFAGGYLDGSNIKSININIANITFDGLKVTDCGNDYAPLLINNIGSNPNSTYTYGYTTLTVNGVYIKQNSYSKGTAIASSLIGMVGSSKAKQINMTFQNIVLPDKKAEGENGGIFSHATLLEQFAYSKDDNSSGATYNFYLADDWKEGKHEHQVTYGKEITGTTEFTDLQKWYYDESINGTPDGLVYDDENNKRNFDSSSYLPYVCTAYSLDENKCTHEIKVNQRVTNIMNGCGTYGHPYRITKEQEMDVLSEYMATGEPRKDWRVTITKSQNSVHTANSDTDYTSDQDIVYRYDGNNWVRVVNTATDGKDDWQEVSGAAKLSKNFMRDYLLNAYYDIHGSVDQGSSISEPQLTLTDFKGFGTDSSPFRGVITSKNNTTLVLEGTGTGNGLIPYSYGSVVKNLKISYKNATKTLTYDTKTMYYPLVCFGGVIGCVLGGDNIIDGVIVEMQNDWKLTLSGDKKHLIQVGGYVGSISGGGVIFRNMTNSTGLPASNIEGVDNITGDTYLYINPYVGRVLDGFAFYESPSKTNTLDNTNKNYKINTLVTTDTGCVDANGNTITVNDEQGLLLLSAIVNSGAASGGISNVYSINKANQYEEKSYSFGGRYGKVRNASYEKIGENDKDATLSISEDTNLPGSGNLPYLIQKYCGNKEGIFSISTNSNVEINLKSGGSYDMTTYENGYQGIGARYVSNAVRGHIDSNVINYPEGIIPELKTFNGKNSTVKMNMVVKEYTDDDFHAASVGGMFNVLRIINGGTISNLTIDTGSTISLSNASSADVGVGGFAGSLVGYTDLEKSYDITMQKIQLNGVTVNSLASAGGIVGNTGKPAIYTGDKTNSTNIAVLLQPKDSQITYGVAFNDCSYSGITVTGKYAAGGFGGYIGATENQKPKSTVNENGGTLSQSNIGENSTISALDNSSWAGGLFGCVNTRMFINMTDAGTKANTQAILQDVNVSAGTAVGGCIGYIGYTKERTYGINNVIVKKKDKGVDIFLNSGTTGTFYAGGIIGYANGDWTDKISGYVGIINNSSIENVQINIEQKSKDYNYPSNDKEIKTNYIAGGIIGCVAGGETKIDGCIINSSKIYGSVASGITGQTDSQMEFDNCSVKGISSNVKTEIKGFSTAGSILGFWTGGNQVTIQSCEAQYLEIEGKDWGVGAFIGDCAGSGVGTLYLFDSSAQDSNVTALGNKDGGGGRWPCVGSIVGNLRNTIKASNILISGITLAATDGSSSKATKGLLFGKVVNSDSGVNIAGISIQKIPDSNKGWELASGGITSNNSYIAFADYSGTALGDLKSGSTAPYVVTSPKSTLTLYESETASANYPYGDGVSWTEENKVEAQEIYANKDSVKDGHYAYSNTGVKSFDFTNIISTYNNNQSTQVTEDFPVIQVANGNANVVKDYLDIITNGGFSAANGLNKAHVTAEVEVYENKNGKFVKADKNVKSAFRVNTDSTGKITFSTTSDYDNTKERFNLLKVTFTEEEQEEKKEHKYNVFVPILVRRMLEMDFTATLTYGTDFKSSNYSNLENHVLESFGSSISGYLTYTYNSAEGKYADYGWQSYIDAGGNLMDMKKSIKFTMTTKNFPKGTQFTLIDKKTGRAYYYSATGLEDYKSGGIEIPLGSFKDSSKPNANSYQEPSISELLGVTVDDKGGNFVKVDENGKPDKPDSSKTYPEPTIKIKTDNGYDYYRLADSSLNEEGTYSIKVKEGNSVTENYYLVVTVPESKDDTTSSALNGFVETVITSTVPNRVHYQRIKPTSDGKTEDNHSNTASTYQLSNGYRQTLIETGNDGTFKKITMDNSTMKIDMEDKIVFPNSQAYNSNDQLYLRFVGGLQKTLNSGTQASTSAEQFPSGTTGEAKFYVYTKDNANNLTYYKYENGAWSKADSEQSIANYIWTSNGGNMELPLKNQQGDFISLQGIRDLLKESAKGENESTFYVRVKLDATLPSAGLDVIPETKEDTNGQPIDYTKLTFFSQLSTVTQSLNYSTNRGSVSNMTTAYYRDEPAGVKLTYDADQIDQLGINLLDLQNQYLDVNKQNSLIDTTATYDLSTMKNLESTLKDSSGIKFTLSLYQKNTDTSQNQEEYQSEALDANNYMGIELKSENPTTVTPDYSNKAWTWTIPSSDYLEDGKIKTSSIFDGSKLTQRIQLKVDVANIENNTHFYSNYKVVLTAEVLDKKGTTVKDTNLSDNIIYTLTKIKLDFKEEKDMN